MNLQDGFAPVLGLGPDSSCCTTIALGKEIEHEPSVHLGLCNNYHIQNEKTSKRMNISGGAAKDQEVEKPKLDLELSLSTVPVESDVTTVIQGFPSLHNYVESTPKNDSIQLIDEGSTSSRWKLRPLLPPLQTAENMEGRIHATNAHGDGTISPVVSTSKSLVVSASGVMQQQRHNTSAKTCKFNGCTRGARGASGLCIAHGGGRRCQRAGCQKGAEGKTVFCKAHGGGRRCQFLGCTKSAEGRTDYCIGHGGGSRCSHDGCTRAARGKSGLCIRHGGGKRCKMENCTKSAEGISGLCISHGGGRRCQYPGCAKGAQGSTMLCKAHGGGKRCTFLGCTRGAEGSTPFCKGHGGGKRCSFEGGCTKSVHGGTLFCVNHGGGKRCQAPECTKSARGRTNFCVRHGGGKRCKSEGCGKSAQGSTDFCKAHGGGRRCSWGQLGSEFGGLVGVLTCDKFARGKSGLCAAHTAQAQDRKTHGGTSSVHALHSPCSSMLEMMKEKNHPDGTKTTGNINSSIDFTNYRRQLIPLELPSRDVASVGNSCLVHFSLPEGRVHGGNLMAMLGHSTSVGGSSNDQIGDPLEPGKSYPMPHSWV
ncbi:unnamed protein product, partial [Thlaspi arvense]